VDHVTLSNAFHGPTRTWATGASYYSGEWVLAGANIYRMIASETVSPFTCTSGASMPTASGSLGNTSSDGTCTWAYQDTLVYTSGAGPWKHQVYTSGTGTIPAIQQTVEVNINIWYGGSGRQTYEAGANGEQIPLLMDLHYDMTGADQAVSGTPIYPAITVAPGDSFVDNLTTSTPLRVDSTKGVTFTNNATPFVGTSYYKTAGEPIAFSDTGVIFPRGQFLSTQGACMLAHAGGPGGGHTNGIFLNQFIMDCAAGVGAISCDGSCSFRNGVLIVRTTTANSFGIVMGYPDTMYNMTIIGNNASNGTCFAQQGVDFNFPLQTNPWYNNVCIGFPIPWAFGATPTATNAGSNMTTAASGTVSPGSVTLAGGHWGTLTTAQIPGTTVNSLSAASALVNPTIGSSFDARNLSTGPLYGGGMFFSYVSPYGAPTITPAIPDIINTPRPTSGRYDVGGWQHP
jgi:hypothetical protein